MEYPKITEYFFQLLAASIDTRNTLPNNALTDTEWQQVYALAQKQNMTAMLATGLERLDVSLRPSQQLMLKWLVTIEAIRHRNVRMNEVSVLMQRKLREDGFLSCMIKGQGVAAYYPDPYKRVPGDIDLWVDCDRARFIPYAQEHYPDCDIKYRDIDVVVYKDIVVEFHLTPSVFYNYFRNRKLQKFFENSKAAQFSNFISLGKDGQQVCVPTPAFNRIYMLDHLFWHYLYEGIGLRQFLDYYFLLRKGFTAEENASDIKTLKRLGLLKFAGATMFVLKKCFNIPERFMLIQPNEREGKRLLKEILIGGNFGLYDPRLKRVTSYSPITFWEHMKRNARFITSYPIEVISSPLFKIWHYYYRKSNGFV